MLLKVAVLFLVFMAVLAMFGKLRLPRLPGRQALSSRRCRHCGRYRIGKGPCPCGEGRG
ncbi:hypothetical protein [Rhodosalinus halophilus]|uniref:hypothetical protein n=1 Tax=Rhodosalinus halophilus TaxID=2259333 RepID=UPI0018F4E4F1|nr:hypothetical protein [Rhodosalinus halophilus]